MKQTIIILIFFFFEFYINSFAQSDTSNNPTLNLSKKALVIGNSNYPAAPLKACVNEANLISEVLKKLGFDVVLLKNAGLTDMKKAISDFGEKVQKDKNTISLFYFSGYAKQFMKENYLIPIDAEIQSDSDVEFECVKLDFIFFHLCNQKSIVSIIILDASRANPYMTSTHDFRQFGLAIPSPPAGTVLAYSAAPGSVSVIDRDIVGLYSSELVKAMQIPNLKLEDIFKQTRKQVYEKSGKKQTPWEFWQIDADIYLNKK
jgi:uncharacterized caspase-like protein